MIAQPDRPPAARPDPPPAPSIATSSATASPPSAARWTALRRLDWDTAFFGATMGAIVRVGEPDAASPQEQAEALERDLATALADARAGGYAHVIFRASADDLPAVWAAEDAGLRLVDVGVDSTIRLDRTAVPQPAGGSAPLAIRAATDNDVPALRDLAGSAFVLSRFSADPFFSPEQVMAFHRQWVANLCQGLADAVLVCEVEGRLAGFVSCARTGDEGRIPLIATDARFRRRGIGRTLVDAALLWFATAGAGVAHVKTQAHNYPALALYHRAGFTVSKTELTFSAALGAATRP
ncbi:MAG: GNAT family N-acetyltransferase [Chloroflexota bacterium]